MKLPLDLGTRAKVTTRTPAASERGGLLVPLISGLGGQRQHLWLLPATQDVLGMRKHEVGAKGADDRDACGQLDGRSSLNLPSTPDDTTSAAYVFASARAIWQGTNRERERESTCTHRTAPALLGGASPGCPLSERSRCPAALPSRPWPSARSSASLAQVQAARGAVAGWSAPAPAPAQAVPPGAQVVPLPAPALTVGLRRGAKHACHVVISVQSSGGEFIRRSSSACVPRCLARTFRSESSSTCGFGPAHCSATTCW